MRKITAEKKRARGEGETQGGRRRRETGGEKMPAEKEAKKERERQREREKKTKKCDEKKNRPKRTRHILTRVKR